jgi:Fe-S-cluster containining protein
MTSSFSRKQELEYKEAGQIPQGWERISRRQAKKRNPKMFIEHGWKDKAYFKCNHLNDDGCSIHQSSPYVCSGYPYYGKSLTELNNQSLAGLRKEYTDYCNLREELLGIADEREYDAYLIKYFSNHINKHSGRLHKSRAEFIDRLIPTISLE